MDIYFEFCKKILYYFISIFKDYTFRWAIDDLKDDQNVKKFKWPIYLKKKEKKFGI